MVVATKITLHTEGQGFKPHIGCQVSHRGVFQDNKVPCLCSGCWFLYDRANYQLNFMCVYWASQFFWSAEDGLTVYDMFCTQYGLYYYTLHNKAKHLVQSFNMHFTIYQINWINSITNNNNEHLPEDQCTVH